MTRSHRSPKPLAHVMVRRGFGRVSTRGKPHSTNAPKSNAAPAPAADEVAAAVAAAFESNAQRAAQARMTKRPITSYQQAILARGASYVRGPEVVAARALEARGLGTLTDNGGASLRDGERWWFKPAAAAEPADDDGDHSRRVTGKAIVLGNARMP